MNATEAAGKRALVHLGAGIGNVVLATPLLVALDRLGISVDLWLSADYAETATLLDSWSAVAKIYTRQDDIRFRRYDVLIPAIPPFYWQRFARLYKSLPNVASRPPDSRFYENEQSYYLEFARMQGAAAHPVPMYRLPVSPSTNGTASSRTLALAPGCKTGEMAAKRWPWFAELATRFDDVAVFGTRDDLQAADGSELAFPAHVRMCAGRLSLRETAQALAASGVVVCNDSGLGHVAAAAGTPTIMMFGPTSHECLGPLPANVTVARAGLVCEPCWFRQRFSNCSGAIDCLRQISVARIAAAVAAILG